MVVCWVFNWRVAMHDERSNQRLDLLRALDKGFNNLKNECKRKHEM
jgi:hypothetical protein